MRSDSVDMRRRVLILVDHYLPGHKAGGPVRTLAGLVHHLGDRLDLTILTSDRDLGDHAPYTTVPADSAVEVGRAQCVYLSPRARSLGRLRRWIRATPHEVMYLNGLFSWDLAIKPLLMRRLGLIPDRTLVIAPRGQLDPGALEFSSLKKRAFLALARALRLHHGAIWQATSDQERESIAGRFGGRVRVVHAPNLVVPIDAVGTRGLRHDREGSQALTIAFVSRISPKKNLEGALEILAGVSCDVDFRIYGPREDARYWRRCEALFDRLPANVRVGYRGVLDPDEVHGVLGEHDLFLLPTRGENFGHAILEALLAGCLVLVSDRTPWRGLEDMGVGWDLPLEDLAAWRAAIEAYAGVGPEERSSRSQAASEWAAEVAADARAVEQNAALFAPPST